MAQLPNLCGVCRRGVRSGEGTRRVRVPRSTLVNKIDTLAKLNRREDEALEEGGLYVACEDCAKVLKPFVVEAVNRDTGSAFNLETLPGNFME